jgi:ABC-type antimicrobial peptide transport system, ATPase component
MLLSARNVTKTFSENVSVLNGVSLDIEKGDFLSVLGASGSGKTTLLSILGGIDKPTGGEVFLDGEDITKFSEKKLAILRRTKIGFVFQFFNLAPYLTAKENILLPIVLGGRARASDVEKAEKLMEYWE